MLLDISVPLHEAERLVDLTAGEEGARWGRLRDGLLRDAPNPMVMDDQREQALRLAARLSERLSG